MSTRSTPATALLRLFADHGAQPPVVIAPGLTWVVGDEGRGKTRLLRALAAEVALAELPHREGPAARAGAVAWFDPAATGLPDEPDPSVEAVLAAAAARYPHFSADACADLFDELALDSHRHKRLSMLSAGSRRKVWMVAALAAGAPVTLLDQPFAALDARSTAALRALLAQVAGHPRRAWVVADYGLPPGLAPDAVIDLG